MNQFFQKRKLLILLAILVTGVIFIGVRNNYSSGINNPIIIDSETSNPIPALKGGALGNPNGII